MVRRGTDCREFQVELKRTLVGEALEMVSLEERSHPEAGGFSIGWGD